MKALPIVFLLASFGTASAAEIDFSAVLKSADGQAFKSCGEFEYKTSQPICIKVEDMTLGAFAAASLNTRSPNMTAQLLVERGQLAARLYKGGKQALSADEIKTIKDTFPATQFPPLEIYAAVQLLDPDSLKK